MTVQTGTAPIFHLSFPVHDLDEAIAFYLTLGGIVGRREIAWADVALFGAQLTLQQIPAEVLQPMPRSRHFGATLPWQDWERLIARVGDFVEQPHIDYAGTDREQAKAMIADPSGNLIELKAYRQPGVVLGPLAAQSLAQVSRPLCTHCGHQGWRAECPNGRPRREALERAFEARWQGEGRARAADTEPG